MARKQDKSESLAALALVLAWLVPGSAHVYLGRRVRGIILFVVIGATFWAGMALGGAMTVNRQVEPWWFMADMLTGVHGLAGWQAQRIQMDRLSQAVQDNPAYSSQKQDLLDQLKEQQNIFRQARDQSRNPAGDSSAQSRARNAQDRIEGLSRQLDALHQTQVLEEMARQQLALTSPIDTAARAYCGVAGLLNLLCMFDALMLAMMGQSSEPARPAKPVKPEGAA